MNSKGEEIKIRVNHSAETELAYFMEGQNKITTLSSEKDELAVKQQKIDEMIVAIQRSTRVTLPSFAAIHNFLRSRYPWYYAWHLKSYANAINISFLFIFTFSILWQMADLLIY